MMDQKITDRVAEIKASSDAKWVKINHHIEVINVRIEEADIRPRSKSLIMHGMPDQPRFDASTISQTELNSRSETSTTVRPDDSSTAQTGTTSSRRNQRSMELLESFLHISRTYLDIDLSADDITDIHRIYIKNGKQPTPVVVEFFSKMARDRILQSRKQLRSAPAIRDHPIYINENLTKRNAHVFALARRLVKDKVIHSEWLHVH